MEQEESDSNRKPPFNIRQNAVNYKILTINKIHFLIFTLKSHDFTVFNCIIVVLILLKTYNVPVRFYSF
jgi:hypothetical protein